MASKQKFFVRAGYFLDDHWSIIATIVSSIGFSFLERLIFLSGWKGILIAFLIIILFIVSTCKSAKKIRGRSEIENENKRLREMLLKSGRDILDIWSNKLGEISRDFKFSPSERISLYKHENDTFRMLGRYSEDPILQRKGRGEYPENEGCIGVAFRKGSSIVLNLPNPEENEDAYHSAVKERCKMSVAVMKNCKMKSRSYAAFRLEDKTGYSVIVFESLEEKGFDVEALEKAMEGQIGEDLQYLMEVLRPIEPSISLAKQIGL